MIRYLVILLFALMLTVPVQARHCRGGHANDPGCGSSFNQLLITEVFVDSPVAGSMTIVGRNFDNGDIPIISLGEFVFPLIIISESPTLIEALLPANLDVGDYLLVVSTGGDSTQQDAYNLTIGTGGPTPGDLITYDSGWFPVTVNTTYTRTHGLGTTNALTNVYFSVNSDGSGLTVLSPIQHHEDASNRTEGGGVVGITTSQIIIRWANVIYRGPTQGTALTSDITSGFARILMLALD